MNEAWHLAQINIGRLIGLPGDPRVAGFMAELDRINALADAADGFVWRLQSDSGNAVDLQPTPDPRLVVNMSVWRDADSLFEFVYRSSHTPVMARRRQWVEPFDGSYQALWWVPQGPAPTVADGLSRLWLMDRFGSSPQAFNFKMRYPRPGEAGAPLDHRPGTASQCA